MVNIHKGEKPIVALPKRFLAVRPALKQVRVARVTPGAQTRIVDET
jgi:hypothetical protein